jgi:hypothetical protein
MDKDGCVIVVSRNWRRNQKFLQKHPGFNILFTFTGIKKRITPTSGKMGS